MITPSIFPFLLEMSIWGHHYHQPSQQPWEGHYPSLWYQLVQASPSADSSSWRRVRTGRHQWYREIHSIEDISWKAETKLREICCKLLKLHVCIYKQDRVMVFLYVNIIEPSGLVWNFDLLQRIWATKLLHKNPWRRLESKKEFL